MRIYILANGKSGRFPEKLEVPETVNRTLAMLVLRGLEPTVVGPQLAQWKWKDSRHCGWRYPYCVGVTCAICTRSPIQTMNHVLQTYPEKQPTVFLFGDVAWSDAALELALAPVVSGEGLYVVGRRGPNRQTGKEWGELYGLGVWGGNARYAVDIFAGAGNGEMWQFVKRHQDARDFEFREPAADDWTDDVDTELDLRGVRAAMDAQKSAPGVAK